MAYKPANPNGQATMANSEPVVIASDQSAIPVTQSGAWSLAANQSVNIAQWNGVAPSLNTGVRDAGTLRVTIATNDSVPVTGTFWQATQPVSGPLTDAQLRAVAVPISGTVAATQSGAWSVSLAAAIPAGTNNIGDVDVLSLPALPAGTNNIGDVDVLSLPALPAGTNNIGDVDVLTLPALPAGTNNIGDVDVLTLPNTALSNWGHGALDAAVPANATLMGVRVATSNPTAMANADLIAPMADNKGRLVTAFELRELVGHQRTALAAAAEATVVTAGAAGVFRDITKIIVTTAGAAAQTIGLKDATGAGSNVITLNYPNAALAPGSPLVLDFNPPLKQATAANNWTMTPGLATTCNVFIQYVERTA